MTENTTNSGRSAVRLDVKLTGETADAIPVVLIGSLGSDRSMWEEQIGPLSEKWPLIAVDLRGHGASPVPDGPYSMSALAADVLATLDDGGARIEASLLRTAVELLSFGTGAAPEPAAELRPTLQHFEVDGSRVSVVAPAVGVVGGRRAFTAPTAWASNEPVWLPRP